MSESSEAAPLSKPRLQEALRLGYSPRSSELTAGVVFLSAAWIGYSTLPNLIAAFKSLTADSLQPAPSISQLTLTGNLRTIGVELMRIFASCWITALIVDLVQVGVIWNPTTPLPHEQRLNPVSGLVRLLGWPTWDRALGLTVKLTLGLIVAAGLCWKGLGMTGRVYRVESLPEFARWTCLVLGAMGTLLLLSGLIDAWIRRQRWRTSLEQTDDERRQRV